MAEEKELVEQKDPVETVQEEKPKEEPKFTQSQLNDLIAKEAGNRASKAEKEILSSLGLTSKEELAKLKEKLDAGKSEEQRREEQREAERKEKEELEKKVGSADLIVELMALGMNKEAARKYAKFAAESDGETAEEKAASFIAENEGLVKKPAPKDLGIKSGEASLNEHDSLLEQMKKNTGLTK